LAKQRNFFRIRLTALLLRFVGSQLLRYLLIQHKTEAANGLESQIIRAHDILQRVDRPADYQAVSHSIRAPHCFS